MLRSPCYFRSLQCATLITLAAAAGISRFEQQPTGSQARTPSLPQSLSVRPLISLLAAAYRVRTDPDSWLAGAVLTARLSRNDAIEVEPDVPIGPAFDRKHGSPMAALGSTRLIAYPRRQSGGLGSFWLSFAELPTAVIAPDRSPADVPVAWPLDRVVRPSAADHTWPYAVGPPWLGPTLSRRAAGVVSASARVVRSEGLSFYFRRGMIDPGLSRDCRPPGPSYALRGEPNHSCSSTRQFARLTAATSCALSRPASFLHENDPFPVRASAPTLLGRGSVRRLHSPGAGPICVCRRVRPRADDAR
jgi:hypothetical protein